MEKMKGKKHERGHLSEKYRSIDVPSWLHFAKSFVA